VKPIVIAAGGTGGHFFPAEALAAALLKRGERVVLMTDARSSAAKSAVFSQGEIFIIPGAGVAGRSIARSMRGLFEVARGIIVARAILKRLDAAVIIGFGGYPAVAPMLAGRMVASRPILILHDQNAVLGKANRLLSRVADHIALSFARTGNVPVGKSTRVTGNPVRPAIIEQAKAVYTAPAGDINITVLGGSLGARIFGTLIPGAMALLPPELRSRCVVTMQCPLSEIKAARAAFEASGIRANLQPFFDNVAVLMAGAHLVISRAGGSTVAELGVVGRPAILIPLTINDDQQANARVLEQAGGAVVVAQGSGATVLAQVLQNLVENPDNLVAMAKAAGSIGVTDAVDRLAGLVLHNMAGAGL
jgi:UDP-N-acetylglucosamine--N-acetylmuramyl-(pentapeptide) pyrophosphoryl-undecaprenol N-acetylglucosamine transferase